MKAFFIGLVSLIAVSLLAGVAVFLFPLVIVFGFFLKIILSLIFFIFSIWLLGKFIIFVWESFLKRSGHEKNTQKISAQRF